MTNDPNDFNKQIIEQFRANGGKVPGDMFSNANMLILHTTGAKSGAERLNPLMYRPLGDKWAIFASKGGAPENPAWYHNLLANPEAAIEVGTETVPVKAHIAAGEERAIWEQQKAEVPQFAEYEASTSRRIPVIVLERR